MPEKVFILLKDLRNFNEIFRKDVTYDNIKSYDNINSLIPIPQNGQTHSNNSSANCRRIVWVCLAILWNWCLKVKLVKSHKKTGPHSLSLSLSLEDTFSEGRVKLTPPSIPSNHGNKNMYHIDEKSSFEALQEKDGTVVTQGERKR